jgi:hypothetical protein
MTNRTLQFLGRGYGSTPATVVATLDGVTIYTGEVPTLDQETILELPGEQVVLFSTEIPMDFAGTKTFSMQVTRGIVNCADQLANYSRYRNPAQDYQYPLDIITLSLTGLVSGSDIVILNTGTEVERVNVDANPTTSYNYVYDTTGAVDIKVYKRGYIPFSILNYSLSTTNASLPVAQVADRNYIE